MIRTRAFPQTYYARTVFPAPIQESVGLHHVYLWLWAHLRAHAHMRARTCI